ncbi:hypothetical protein A3K86_20515 [Photobacterium jeanii]|uniref:Amidohydrolase 3 domain-containing protein n=1 Tax=Photobacterium jeanii TaxID=858640 RepID=A0A178K2K7_9GAMM|nr:amidohydrolase [Photobacterium jeanii]OAN11336.1 hypothetical protein A3K86_20515 [Photobacterium jeanii]PST90857.1 hypothetical protein C9I91_09620 [Photobacterium jeanii]
MKRKMLDLTDNDNILSKLSRRNFLKATGGAAAIAAATCPVAQAVASTTSSKARKVTDKVVLYVNGKIYQGDKSNQKWAEAFAVQGEKFIQVGTTEEILKLRTPQTLVVDLRGHTVLPGLIDDHMHPEMAVENYNNVRVDELSTTWDEFKALVKKELKENPHKEWVFGGNLDYLWDDGSAIKMFGMPSHKKILDELIPDKPAFFWECSGHAALVNSKALELCGITKDTPDPVGGHFVKDENGELTGVLRELAANVAWEKWLETLPTPQELGDKQLKPIFSYLNSYGLTSVSEVWSREMYGQAYKYLDDKDELTLRLAVYATVPVEFVTPKMQALANSYIDNHQQYNGKQVKILGVKYILDGAAAGQTARLVHPYEGSDSYIGPWRNTPEQYKEGLFKYDAMGLCVHAHCAGDGAARLVLDSVEELRKTVPNNNADKLIHRVAHVAMVDKADINRFAELNVHAEFSPVFWYDMPAIRVVEQDIGAERVQNNMYPMKPIFESGAPCSIGTDWTVTPVNPWIAIETAVTRRGPGVTSGPSMNAEEHAVSLENAVWLYTQGGADSQKRADEIGSISQGKYADFVVIDQNIFDVPITDVHKTKVLSTVLGGSDVYLSSKVEEILELGMLTGDYENNMQFASVGRQF